jgi:hypothetical protein
LFLPYHASKYAPMTKYNEYDDLGGTVVNKVSILDPNASNGTESVSGAFRIVPLSLPAISQDGCRNPSSQLTIRELHPTFVYSWYQRNPWRCSSAAFFKRSIVLCRWK